MTFTPSKYIFSFVLFFVIYNTNAQLVKTSDYNTWNGGIRFGVMRYYGDVRQLKYSPENKYKKTNTNVAIEVGKSLNHIFGLRANALFGGLSGSNPDMNLHFTNSFKEFNLEVSVNLNNLISFYPRKAKVINAYIYFGGGAIFYHSLLKSFDEDVYMNGWGYDSLGNKSAAKMTFTMPFGIGIKYKADEKFDIGIETQLHLVNSDNLDAYTGKSLYNDRFGVTSLSLIYKFGNKKEYVEWVKPNIDSLADAYYASNDVKKNAKDSIKKATTTIVSKENTTKTKPDSSKLSTKKPTTNVTTITVTEVEKNYYIIAGIYKTKKLAKDAVKKYQGKGYPDAKFLGVTASGSTRVSVKSYETAEDAAKDYAAIKKAIPTAKLLQKKGEKEYTDITSKVSSLLQAVPKTTTTTTNINTTKVDTVKTKTTNTTITNTNTTTNNQLQTLNTNTNKTNINTTKADTTKSTITKSNTTNNSNTTNTNVTNVNTNTTTTIANTTTVEKRFFIISGSFPTEAAAQAGVEALKAKGFKDAVVVGKNDAGSVRIAYKAYATREEANKDLPSIKASSNPSAWIFEKK
jgi:OmpA-OmpF porin, OOP family